MKIQSVTFDLLSPTALYYVSEKKSTKSFLYLAGDVEYFGKDHFPYGLVALFFLITFTSLPAMLFFLYPCRWFQKFLNRINCNYLTLRTFMDVFQGNYKDGTNNTRDYRFFSGVFFITRFIIVGSFLLLNSQFFFMFIGIITLLWFTVAIVRPQRQYKHYLLDCFSLMILSLIIFSLIGIGLQHENSIAQLISFGFLNIAFILPVLYVSGSIGYWVIFKRRIPQIIAGLLKRTAARFTDHYSFGRNPHECQGLN